jgi:signal transduction histidine kinase
VEFFLVLIYPYFTHTLILEFIWIPEILSAMAVFLPSVPNVFLILLLGIPGSIFLSYGYDNKYSFIIGGVPFAFHIAVLPFYFSVSLLAVVLCCYCMLLSKREKYTKSLEVLNEQLNKINRSIFKKLFYFENDIAAEERKKISNEVHNTVGYVFVNLIMMLQAVSAIFFKDTKKAESLISDARNYAERGINEIRHILHNVRDYSPARLSIQNEIYNIGIIFSRATEVKITIDYGNWPITFSENINSFFLSFLQESLTNSLKHGHAGSVSIACWSNDSSYHMSIADNGIGTALPIKKGIGITALEDTVSYYNGNVIIRSDKTGFKIHVSIPHAAANQGFNI